MEKEITLRQRMVRHIKSLDRYCTDEYLSDKPDTFLLNLMHPSDYEFFRKELNLIPESKKVVKPETV